VMDINIIHRYTLEVLWRGFQQGQSAAFHDVGQHTWLVGASKQRKIGLYPLRTLGAVKSGSRQTLSERISDVLCTCAFDKFHGSISHHVSKEMYSYVHVTRAFAVCWVLAHKDARCNIFPLADLCRTML
jgi:hypothetical protein